MVGFSGKADEGGFRGREKLAVERGSFHDGVPAITCDCYKNWDGPSASMETDIILRGF